MVKMTSASNSVSNNIKNIKTGKDTADSKRCVQVGYLFNNRQETVIMVSDVSVIT